MLDLLKNKIDELLKSTTESKLNGRLVDYKADKVELIKIINALKLISSITNDKEFIEIIDNTMEEFKNIIKLPSQYNYL